MPNRNDEGKRNKYVSPQREESGELEKYPGSSPEQRREMLRKILAGSGIVIGAGSLSGKWSRPVIDSVILPAHAQTSLSDPCALSVTVISGGVEVVVTGLVLPPTGGVVVTILVELLSAATVVDTITIMATTNATGVYTSALVTLSGMGATEVRATTSLSGVGSAVCQEFLPTTTTTTTTTKPPIM